MNKLAFYGVLVIALLASQISGAAIVPVYQVTGTDATWTEIGTTGAYTVATSAEDYNNEIWERPVQDNEWSDSGGVRTSSKLYYGYADLKAGAWGVGTNSDDSLDYLFVRWEVVGAFQQEPGKAKEDKLLEGHYYFYAEPFGKNAFAVEVPSGKDLGADFGDVTGKVNIYDDTNDDVPGTGITVTGEGGDSFGNVQVAGEGRTNTATFVTEVAVELADLGLTLSDFTANPLDYAYIGVAVSNPSSPDSDLFANDFFVETIGFGVEYDTIQMGTAVPIPGAVWLLGFGLIGLVATRRKFGK